MHQSAAVAAGPVTGAREDRVRCAPARAADADSESIQVLAAMYDRHAAVVLSLCRARLGAGRLAEAEDACQETFMRAHRKIMLAKSPRDETGVRRWLYAIARHVCRERLRAMRRREHYELRAHQLNGSLSHAAATADALEGAAQHEAMEQLTSAMQQLPEREQLALHLHYLDGDAVAAAQRAMHVSRSGYYKLVARAREAIARHLGLKQPTGQP